jgi:hypothetical protein
VGLIRKVQVSTMAKDARRARTEGGRLFVCRITPPQTASGTLADVAEQLEGIEAEGWRLEHTSYLLGAMNRPTGYFVFRATDQRQPLTQEEVRQDDLA